MLYDVEIINEDDEFLAAIEAIDAPSREAACEDAQVGQYLEQIRDEHPNATVGRVIAR